MASPDEVIILIHGVESSAEGMRKVKESFYDDSRFPPDKKYIDIFNYGYFPAIFSALPPLQGLRSVYYHYFKTYLEKIFYKYGQGTEINILAHSFGTYLTLKALEEASDIAINKIVMVGSVIETDYNFNQIDDKVQKVHNYTGELDFVQYFATLFTTHMGMSGRDGFESDFVKDIDPPGLWRHLSYSEPENIEYLKKEFI